MSGRPAWLRLVDRIGPLLGLLAIAAFFGAMRPATFLTGENLEVILLQTAVVGVAALGMTLIIISGGIDLSVGSIIAVVAVSVALLLNAGAPPLVAAAGGVIVGGLCGTLNGALISYARIAPFIVTLGTLGALRGAAKGLAGEQMLVVPEQGWLEHIMWPLRQGQWWLMPAGIWAVLALALATAGLLRWTRFGRHVIAIGSNEETARLCGVRVAGVKLYVYVLGGLLAGTAGVLQFARENVGNPTTAQGYELNVIAAVVIGGGSLAGGQGSVLGTIVGSLIMSTIANGCAKMQMSNWVQEIITGAIIVLAVALDRLRRRGVR